MQISNKIEYWKNRLLDLGKRNRLINCVLPKSGKRVSRTAILIYKPSLENLWDILVEGEASLQFPVPIDGLNDNEVEQESFFQTDSFGNGILTNQSPIETCKTLRSLMKKAKEFTEEKGLNALYIAFGFLYWRENGTEGQDMRSPLILVPVTLSQESLKDPFLLSRLDDEITVNHALEQKLLNDFGIILPQFDEYDNWLDYLSQVREVCSHLKWKIQCDAAQLSLFSFLKINMYRDLEKNAEKISEHLIVRALNGEGFDSGIDCSDISDYNHDMTEPRDVFSVLDADSSQQDAILLAKRGASFVLQGPPGTGKSQTITNIIAELIADGKKVLFVSEKMAALEVVYKRLKQTGLDHFCLTLHSYKAKRREILDQLQVSLKLSRNRVQLQQEAFNTLFRLKDVRESLNTYAQELHTVVEPLGKTIYEVNGYVAIYGGYRNIDYVQKDAETFTSELLAKCESALKELTRIVDQSGYQENNPWNECVLTNVTHEFRQQFLVDALKLLSLIENGDVIYNDIAALTGATNLIPKFTGIKDVLALSAAVTELPKIPFEWLKVDMNKQIRNVDLCSDAQCRIKDLNEFIRNLKQYTQSLLTAIEEVSDYKLAATSGRRRECNANYASISEKFIMLLPTGEVPANITAFRERFELYQKLAEKHEHAKDENSQASEMLSAVIKELDKNQKLLSQRLIEWQETKNVVIADFDEKIMSIESESILTRYRTMYRSRLARPFSSAYRRDRKVLLGYCKKNVRMAYSEALVYLDKVLDAQNAKVSYDKQMEIVDKATMLKQEKEKNLAEIKANLTMLLEEIDINKAEFEKSKRLLITAVENCVQSYDAQLKRETRKLSNYCRMLGEGLEILISEDTNFDNLKQSLESTLQLQKEIDKNAISDEFSRKICIRDFETLQNLEEYVSVLADWAKSIEPWLNKFAVLFEDSRKKQFTNMPLAALRQDVQNCRDNFASLEYLIDYRNAERQLTALGIDSYLEKAKGLNLTADEIIPVFNKCFYRSWLDAVMPKFPSVNSFRRERHDGCIAQFKELDKLHLEISKAALQAKLISHLPNFDSFSASSGEIALLRREMAKQRKLMPIRKLIAAIPNLLPALKPCMMMSPLSVSIYLGSSGYEFDTVLFDEASQVRTEDAICSIFRAKQVIIAGDSKQLPPTDFFSSSISDAGDFYDHDEEINDTGAYESLLDEAAMLPSQKLLWHYRSKHEYLIAFSNAKIYQGDLITFPSSVEKADGMGVEYIHVMDGIYDRGGRNGNRKEAEQIAELVFNHFRKHPNRSLGIIAFGEVQQTSIEEAIIRKRHDNPQYEIFFKEDKEEPLFIKNLETVQGDERDTIIFSIGYAPDASGKFIMNFGPLSRNGGERRLNVAITRARYNLKLVGSILPTNIDTDRISGLGPKLLRLYIDFAINGIHAILAETSLNGGISFDSPFEESVYNFLSTNGYDVITQVGCSGYRIDMAIRHPKYHGRYAIGIECDGAAYHSARNARERDRLRQTILEDMGWKIYRVWSTDWIKDQQTEGERLLKTIESAIAEYHEEPQKTNISTQKSTDFLDIRTKSTQEVFSEKFMSIRSYYVGRNAIEIPTSDFERTMIRVLENGLGLDKAALFKETALYGYLWQRQGSNIKEKLERAYQNLLKQRKIKEEAGKIKLRERIIS